MQKYFFILLIFHLWSSLGCFVSSSSLTYFKEEKVLEFLSSLEEKNVSSKCVSRIGKVNAFLSDPTIKPLKRRLFSESYAIGNASHFYGRDADRWLFNFYKCLHAANETSNIPSKHPLSYCYAIENTESGLAYGSCMPSSCEISAFLNQSIKENEVTCIPSRRKTMWYEKPIPIITLCFDATIVLLMVMSTFYHAKQDQNKKTFSTLQQLFLSFSLKKNITKITAYPKNPKSTITCLFGLRFFAMLWTIIGHSFIVAQYYMQNVEDYKNDLVDSFWNQWITNVTLAVDIFFTLSGTLVAFIWSNKWMKNTKEQEPSWTSFGYWLTFYRHRIIRLWPAYIYTLVMITWRYSIMHYQPAWPQTDPSIQCPKYWWQNMLFINSLTENLCIPWTWYIGTEFIFYLISPIFLLSLRKNQQFGLMLSVGTILGSSLLNLWAMYEHNFPPTQFLWKQPEIFNQDYMKHHELVYIKPQYRIGPYIVGLLLGWYLAKVQNSDVNETRSQSFILKGWILAIISGFWPFYGLYPALQGWDGLWFIYHYFYGSIHRTTFSLSLSWLIYACHTGIGGPINDFLSLKIFLPLSSLSYSVYLFHMIPVVFTYMIAPFPMIFATKWRMAGHVVIQLVSSYVFGSLCAFGIEFPAINIEQVFTRMKLREPKKKQSSSIITTTDAKNLI